MPIGLVVTVFFSCLGYWSCALSVFVGRGAFRDCGRLVFGRFWFCVLSSGEQYSHFCQAGAASTMYQGGVSADAVGGVGEWAVGGAA